MCAACLKLGSEERGCKNRAVCVLVPAGRGEFSNLFYASRRFGYTLIYSAVVTLKLLK